MSTTTTLASSHITVATISTNKHSDMTSAIATAQRRRKDILLNCLKSSVMKRIYLLLIVCCMGIYTKGQVSLPSIGSAYTQNFNGLATTGSSNTWTDNTTISGWY